LITEWELWACANEMIRQHGFDAAIQAAMKADALADKGDIEGQRTWVGIVRRINELVEPSGTPNQSAARGPLQ